MGPGPAARRRQSRPERGIPRPPDGRRPRRRHDGAGQPVRAGDRRSRAWRRSVGRHAGGVRSDRSRRISRTDLGQAHRQRSITPWRSTGATIQTSVTSSERDWQTIGPRLAGKIHLTVGTSDQWYFANAVRYVDAFLKTTTNPPYGGSVEYRRPLHPLLSGRPEFGAVDLWPYSVYARDAADGRADAENGSAIGRREKLALLGSPIKWRHA